MNVDDLLDALAAAIAERLPQRTESLPVLWDVPEVMRQTGLGKERVYSLIRAGDIEGFQETPGRGRWYVVPESVVAWRDRRAGIQAASFKRKEAAGTSRG